MSLLTGRKTVQPFDLKNGMVTDADGSDQTLDARVTGSIHCDESLDAP